MKNVIKIFTGIDVTDDYNAHPVKQVEFAQQCVEEAKNGVSVLINSNSPDFCSAVYYIALKVGGVDVEFFVDNKHVDNLDIVFAEFNRSFEKLDEIIGIE